MKMKRPSPHNSFMPLVAFLVALVTSQNGAKSQAPPPDFRHPYEPKDNNKSIDQVITDTLGGIDIASNIILADEGSNILAELDMYLTQDQFLSMYEPPKPEDMVKMGMMPTPVGAPAPSADEGYFFDFSEDYKGSGVRTKRKAVRRTTLRWTNAEVPYSFATGHFDEKEEYMMRRSMTEWERYTCLNFRPSINDDKNSVRFQNGVGCNSQLGMVGGIQNLNLQAPGCRFKGLYLHEIGHAVGLVHEHQLPDRDRFIRILYHNVSPHMRIWFNKYTSQEVNQMQVPYELSSVMHYGITAFAKDGKSQTIQAMDKSKEDTIGKVYLKELAYTDVAIVNLMYNCSSHCLNPNRCGPEGHLDQNCNCICRDGSSDCDRTKQTRNDRCRNNYDSWSCYIWANQGECDRNAYYMKQQCAKACNMCGDDDEEQSQGGCKDVYTQEKCTVWKQRGDCITNPMWMKKSCGATCNLCGDSTLRPEVNCQDTHSESHKCEEWAKNGECIVNSKWMFTNCRKSCAMCLDDGSTATGGGGVDEDKIECEDTHHNCGAWARNGECESNPPWMISNCRKSCQKCEDDTCKNLYDDVQCKIWSDKGECVSNTQWMGRHCAKSCGRGLCEGENPDSTPDPRTTGSRATKTTKTTPRSRTTRPTTTKGTTGSGSCFNRHSSDTECDIWAKNDHCNINPNWMKKNCAKACAICSTGETTTKGSGTDQGTDNGGEVCADRETRCAVWAKHGFCDSNPRYNLLYCKKSCNNCNGCRDAEFLCPVWAKDGHCQKNPRYMLRHCQKSCKACYKSQDGLESFKPTDNPTGEGSENGAHFLITSHLIWLCIVVLRYIVV